MRCNDTKNTRWVHYALPEGKPPKMGWPAYVIFPPWPVTPNDQAVKKTSKCGNSGGIIKMNSTCMAYMKTHCNFPLNASAQCEQCVSKLKHLNQSSYRAAGCDAMIDDGKIDQEVAWCKVECYM